MANRTVAKLSIPLMAALAGVRMMAVIGPSLAQPVSSAAFDVTSIKPNNTGSGVINMNPTPNGGMVAENVTAGMLIRVANEIQDKQISGGPKWLFEDRTTS